MQRLRDTIAVCLRVGITVCLRITITACLRVYNSMTHTSRTNNSIVFTVVFYLDILLNRKFNVKKDGISLTSILCCVQVFTRWNISINDMLFIFSYTSWEIKLLCLNY